MNSPERDLRLIKLLDIALDLDPEQLNDFLDAVEPSLRADLKALVAASKNAPSLDPLGIHLRSLLDSSLQAMQKPRLVPGQFFAGYQIDNVIGKGGMGEVYKAHEVGLDRDVVIKLPLVEVAQDEDYRRRFEEEAKILANVKHPNVVVIHASGDAGGILYIVTEFVEGETLRDHISKKRMTLDAALVVAIQVASGLEAAHDKGVVHRDVKPENIMLQPNNHVKILDFGLAKRAGGEPIAIDTQAKTLRAMITKPSQQMGTPKYMSPEQWNGDNLDVRTDIFSFGIVLYEMVTGRLPFDGPGPLEIKEAVLQTEPLPLDHEIPKLPALLQRIIVKSLRKNRDKRYQSIKDLRVDLEEVRDQLTGVGAWRQSLIDRGPEHSRIDSAVPPGTVSVNGQLTYDAFISYSHDDAEWVRNWLVPKLRQDDISICIDYGSFEIGLPITVNIDNGVASSRCCVPVLTPAWIESRWASYEGLLIKHQEVEGHKCVLPLLLKPVQKLPAYLEILTRVDFVNGEGAEKEFAKLSRAIRAQRRTPDQEVGTGKPITQDAPADLGPPIPLPANSEIPGTSASWPLDIGTIWGLERGRFIGILACSRNAEVYENLLNVEHCFYESALQLENASESLPRRVWRRVSPHRRPDDLWVASSNTNAESGGIAQKDSFHNETILGFFLDINAAEFTTSLKASVHNWSKVLTGDNFVSGQDAFVICVASERLSHAREVAEQIYQQLKGSSATTIDLLTLRAQVGSEQILGSPLLSEFDAFEADSKEKAGSYVWAWLRDAAKNPLLQSEVERNRYPDLIQIYLSLSPGMQRNGEPIPAFKVVADLDRISSWSGELDRQFLDLVKTWLPERALELVSAYSRSKRPSARRDSLIFSLADDLFLDAWVEGTGLGPELFPDGEDLSAEPSESRLVADALAFSLMRRCRSSNKAETITALNRLRSRGGMGSSAQAVCELFIGEVKQECFINSQREEAYLMAIRAGVSFDPRLSALTYLNIDNYEVWRLLTALPPTEERVSEILSMGKGSRAVFGLCTSEEWEEIARDKPLMDKILRCRQQRRLSFGPAPQRPRES